MTPPKRRRVATARRERVPWVAVALLMLVVGIVAVTAIAEHDDSDSRNPYCTPGQLCAEPEISFFD